MKKNFGLIGCGMIAGFHAKAIAEIGGTLVACYDHLPQAAERIAASTGCKPYSDLSAFLAEKEMAIVTICTPSGAHLAPALAAAAAGKHLIVEKPLEITLERCDQMIDACQKYGVQVSTVFHSRFHQSALWMKQAVDSKRFGRLTLGNAIVKWYRTQEYYDSGAWRGTWELDGGGALMNQAIHTIDLLTWLMGPVVQVTAQTALLAHERIAVEDTAVATVQFANGALGVIEASTAAYPGYLKRIELHGSAGSAIMEEEDITHWDFTTSLPSDAVIREQMTSRASGGGGAADPTAIGHHGHAKLFADVVNAIETNRQPLIDGYEARRSVEIILAIYESARTGKTVSLPTQSPPR